jgi:hypothetical protein
MQNANAFSLKTIKCLKSFSSSFESHPSGPKLTTFNRSSVILAVGVNSGGFGVSGVL